MKFWEFTPVFWENFNVLGQGTGPNSVENCVELGRELGQVFSLSLIKWLSEQVYKLIYLS